MLTNAYRSSGRRQSSHDLPLGPALFLQNLILNCPVRWWLRHDSCRIDLDFPNIGLVVAQMLIIIMSWGDFQKNEDFVWHRLEGEIFNWTNWHNFGCKIMSIWYIFQIQLLSAIYEDNFFFPTFISNTVLKW